MQTLYRYNEVPVTPLSSRYRCILTVTELPYLILWAYAIYWIEVCIKVGGKAPAQIWMSAAVAGLLVGLGLNANAYRALRKPLSRTRKKRIAVKEAAAILRRKGASLETRIHVHNRTDTSTHLSISTLECQPEPLSYESQSPEITHCSVPIFWTEDETILDIG
eukprot:Blabericola_migrator_1__11271@NODE_663_length_6971_cov_273_239426_g484_i0_p5_GENE_NODE_663_length_6971_cov_273_239426_g484_i0NODE_663_length_6971_cov_273_239426_g484_i0_p5_ORF_typecomplete_len163_score25_38_NODE_663_length_6971_cov_273_239426_g484_i063396827